jgi:carbon monoxide dehydrogenase subunit G
MSEIKSGKIKINCPISKIYGFVSDFNNFQKLMPDQVTNWQSTSDSCSFNISGMGALSLRIREKFPETKVVIVPEVDTKIPFTFELICRLQTLSEDITNTEFVFDHEMPAMISLMASRPLQNMVEIFAKKLKENCEKPGF